MTGSDAELVALARTGDREAFGELVLRHERAMLAVARAYFACDADAQDAVQDAFVKAFRAVGDLRDDKSFPAWLTTITVRQCIDTLRTNTSKVSLETLSSTGQFRQRLGQEQLTPATLTTRGEEAETVKAAMGCLPETLRVALMLRYVEHLTYEQIAAYLGIPASTVRGRLARGKSALRNALAGMGLVTAQVSEEGK
jgi:RNA polymerase sigma-70 factor (ECF subfamily)